MTDHAAIYDVATGDTITQGLQPCTVSDEAVKVARRVAADRGVPVLLVDADGSWHVAPNGEATPAHQEVPS